MMEDEKRLGLLADALRAINESVPRPERLEEVLAEMGNVGVVTLLLRVTYSGERRDLADVSIMYPSPFTGGMERTIFGWCKAERAEEIIRGLLDGPSEKK
jgi:hypothetical protein